MRRVVVTGLGAVTPLGVGTQSSWSRLLNGKCGIVSVRDRGAQFAALPSRIAGCIPQGRTLDGGWDAKRLLNATDERKMAVFTQYAMAASHEALTQAGWFPNKEKELESTGVCLGSGIGSFEDVYNTSVAYEKGGYKKVSPLFVPRLLINMAAGHVSMRYGFKGPNHSVTTACTTGVHAIGDAARLIAFGDANVMLAGGAESCVHPLAMAGFSRARSLAIDWNEEPQSASRPFDKDRAGFVIGEGAGVIVLEALEHARSRNAIILAEVKGYGLSADSHHMTAPREDGRGPLLSMRRALKNARLKPADIGYINAHATSTILGDASENKAIKTLFLGEEGYDHAADIAVSSIKGALGHLLGAAGAVEAIYTILALQHSVLPPTINLEHPGDPKEDFPFNYVPKIPQDRIGLEVALSNSFGFGGTNATLCLARYN